MGPNVLLLGHRGCSGNKAVPENTLAAFDLALQKGCDGFEFDVRLTGCGRAVVCHDVKIAGVTVSKATRTQLLELARLEDIILRYEKECFLNIELKVKGLEAKLLTLLRNRLPQCGYVVSSFLPEVLFEIKARRDGVPVGIICKTASQLGKWRMLPVDYVIVHKSLVTRALVEEVHDTGCKIFVWTVNQAKVMRQFAAWDVDGIISDDIELLAKTFGRERAPSLRNVN
jgi:glycerophosphoryl diester phosphodiesterase